MENFNLCLHWLGINHPTFGGLEQPEFVSMACDHQERAHARTRQRLSKFDEARIDEADDQIQASGFHVHPNHGDDLSSWFVSLDSTARSGV